VFHVTDQFFMTEVRFESNLLHFAWGSCERL